MSVREGANTNWCPYPSELLAGHQIQVAVTVPNVVAVVHVMPYVARHTRLGKNLFVVNSEILGVQIWRKKCINFELEITTKQRELNIEPKCIFFLPFDR